jgi:hypothetical protein
MWFYCSAMAETVTRIDLPDQADRIKALAADAGLGVREYVDRAIHAAPKGSLFTNDQLLAVLTAMPPLVTNLDSAEIIRELRGPLPDTDGDRH